MARSGSMESLFTTFRDALFSADHHADDPAPRAEPDDAQAKRRNFVRQVAAAGGAPLSPEATVKEATAAGATGRRGAVMDSSGSISPVRPVSLGKSRSRSERRHAKHIDHGDQDANSHAEAPQPLAALGRHHSDPISPHEDRAARANFPPKRPARTAAAAGVDARLPSHFGAPMRRSRSDPGDAEPVSADRLLAEFQESTPVRETVAAAALSHGPAHGQEALRPHTAAPQRESRDQSRHLGHVHGLRHDIQALRRDYIMGSDAGPFKSGGGDNGGERGGRERERERAQRSREAATLRKSNSDPSMHERR